MSGMEMVKDEHTTDVRITAEDAKAARNYLARHDATDLAEALGLVGYLGHEWRSTRKKSVAHYREAIA